MTFCLFKGRKLFEKKFALFIHTNEILRELWAYESNDFSIRHGTVKFFENPELCYDEIQNFMLKTFSSIQSANATISLAEVSFNFNGYRRLTCSNRTIELKFNLEPKKLLISWNVSISDFRRLKGFILSYIEVPQNFSFDENDVEFLQSSSILSSYKSLNSIYFNMIYEWSYLYVQFDEYRLKNKTFYTTSIDVEPFTRYAVYLKADLTMDETPNWSYNKSSLSSYSFNSDKMISKINYVYSLPARNYFFVHCFKIE